MRISKEVQEALKNHKPVVALETTIISHGMPYPKNVETALKVEQVVRDNGAVPATIGIIDGEPVIGLSKDEIELFGKRKGIRKVSKRDLAIVEHTKEWGATTVSGTIVLACKAGIEVFVTGGIGGVHRGAETTFDISRDLFEIAENPITVVCSGAKAILDIPKTLEVLETLGVPVLSYKEKGFAQFYTRSSSYPVDFVFNDPKAAADIIKLQRKAGLCSGILISNPCPEEDSLPTSFIEPIIEEALKDCEKQGIKGKDITPYLLKEIVEKTGGKSLETNIALILNNARMGSKISCNLVED
jgi:pseudouridine-5'-phosphate glycosidase